MTGPQRRITDHWHPEYWTEAEQVRFEERVDRALAEIRAELKTIGNRITLMLGAIGLMAFLLPIAAPFLRAFFGVDVPPSQSP